MKSKELLQSICVDGAKFVLSKLEIGTKTYETHVVDRQYQIRDNKGQYVFRLVSYYSDVLNDICYIPVKLADKLDAHTMLLSRALDIACASEDKDVEEECECNFAFKRTPWLFDSEYMKLTERDKYEIYTQYKLLKITKGDTECPLCGCSFSDNGLFVCDDCGRLLDIEQESRWVDHLCVDCFNASSDDKAYEDAVNQKIDISLGK